jgi:predicted ATP-dependent endonuclease of OLD family
MPVKIVNLKADNFKRLEAVEIDADEYVQFIGGRNSQGKSSVLDAIFLALGGGIAAKTVKKPVREGEDEAKVVVDLGAYVVTKEWKNDKATLKIESKDGAKYANPQAFLDKCLGAIAFDPLMFMRLSPKDQKEELLKLVELDINLEANQIARQEAYDERTEVGREVTRLEGQIAGLGAMEAAPDAEVSAQELIDRIRAAETAQRDYNLLKSNKESALARIAEDRAHIADIEFSLAKLNAQIDEFEPIENVEPLEEQLSEVESTNAKVRKNQERLDVIKRITVVKESYANLNDEISAIDKTKADALAKAQFPVAGLSFDDSGILFNDIPLMDASDSEKIRVAIGIAMALNSEIRIIRISDGSLLDSSTIALITQMAQDKDYQLWIETVGDNGVGVIIEDGKILKDYGKV